MESVIHFELPVEDFDRASKFYKDVFCWDPAPIPNFNYVVLRTTESNEMNMSIKPGAINGALILRSNLVKNPVVTINVYNIDQTIEKILDHGGKIVLNKLKIGDIGYSAYVEDCEGNIVGLWENIVNGKMCGGKCQKSC